MINFIFFLFKKMYVIWANIHNENMILTNIVNAADKII